jgi:formylglycine-generating enzyme required for sulfatase activity
MRRFLLILGVFMAVAVSASFAEDKKGYVQVECEPGVKIFLDDEFKGTTNADEGGLIIQDIPVGNHMLKAVKEGFSPQEKSVSIKSGEVLRYKVDQFVPKIRIEEKGDEGAGTVSAKTGVLVINSLPIDCTVHCPALGLDKYAKKKDMLQLSDVPEGSYEMSFSWKDKQLKHVAQVKGGLTVRLMANFIKGAVEETVEKTVEKPVEKPSENVPEDSTASSAEFKSPAFEKVGKNTQGYMEYRHKQTGMVFVLLPGGTFKMGNDGGEQNERPVHEVQLDGFLIAKYEVTQAIWTKVMGNNSSNCKGDDNPVEQVSWNDCQEFCKKTGLRLPTEAEWEYACRAGTTTKYYWGDDAARLGKYAWIGDNSGDKPIDAAKIWKDVNGDVTKYAQALKDNNCRTHPVGRKQPNCFGLFDMSGNVGEWCGDWYGGYAAGFQDNPTGPGSGEYRVVRWGCWYSLADHCQSSYRYYYDPAVRYYGVGFRCVQDLTK